MWLLLAFLSAALLGFYDAFKKQALKDNAVLPVLFLNTVFQVDFDAIRMLGVPKFRAYADLGDGFSSTGKTATVNGVKCKTYKITFEDSDDVLLAYDEQNKVLYEYDNETKDWIEL